MDALYALARAARPARDRGRRAGAGLALAGQQRRRARRYRHLQLSSEQEHRRRSKAARWSSTTTTRRSASRRCAFTASATCPTARATSRFPAASSTCRTSTRGSALRSSRGCRSSCATRRALVGALFRALRDRSRRACCRRGPRRGRRPFLEHVLRRCCRSTGMTIDRNGVPRRDGGARHRHRCIVRSAASVHARPALRLPRRRVSERRAHRARDRDAAAARRA